MLVVVRILCLFLSTPYIPLPILFWGLGNKAARLKVTKLATSFTFLNTPQ